VYNRGYNKKGAKMLTQNKLDKMIHEYNNGGIKSVFGLTNYERKVLIRYFAKNDPKCPCDKAHNG
jgi:hypothetical protein